VLALLANLVRYSLADEVLEHGALARALAAHYGNLRQIKLHMYTELRECILQLVHDRDQLFHTRVARHPATGIAKAALRRLIVYTYDSVPFSVHARARTHSLSFCLCFPRSHCYA